jgi:L-ascorbate metabolism protein UlaG (beta-lactamase superfamily)
VTAAGTLTWWGAAGVEIAIGDHCLVIDPYLHPQEPRADYICLTRETHEHCHEPTLERLVQGERFKRLLAPRSCTVRSTLDVPVPTDARDLDFVDSEALTVMYPKITRRPGQQFPGTTEVELDRFRVEAVESSEYDPVTVLGSELHGKRYRPDDGQLWPAATGAFVGPGILPALGYVVTHLESGITVYHPGDLQEPFDRQRELRGRIDYLLLPMATLEGVELTVVDSVRPRYVVPIHYRVDDQDFPIPLEISDADLATTDLTRGRARSWADPDVYRREIHSMMSAHWYPTPARPLERIQEITPQLAELGAVVVVLEAGRPHCMPARGA